MKKVCPDGWGAGEDLDAGQIVDITVIYRDAPGILTKRKATP